MVPLWLAQLRLGPRWPQVAHPSLSWGTVPGCSVSWEPLRAQASPLLFHKVWCQVDESLLTPKSALLSRHLRS